MCDDSMMIGSKKNNAKEKSIKNRKPTKTKQDQEL